MDYLRIPLRIEDGAFARSTPEEMLREYVNLFFTSRKYESRTELEFGIDVDDLTWMDHDEYVRLLVEEFNHVHRGRMKLQRETGGEAVAPGMVRFVLRQTNRKQPIAFNLEIRAGE